MSTSLTDIQLYANNVFSTIASTLGASDTSIPVTSGDGAKFPYPTGDEFFLATLDSEDGIEVVKCTSRIGDTLIVERAQEGTFASPFPAGTMIQVRVTKGTLERFSRLTDRLYDLDSVDDLPAADLAYGNSFICKSSDEEGNPIVAIKREDLWRFLSHSTNLVSGVVETSDVDHIISEASSAIEATTYIGRYVIQFTSGPLKGQARLITGASGGRIEWSKATEVAADVGDQFDIYISDAYQFSLMANLGLIVYRGEFGLGGSDPMWPYPTMNVTSVATGFYHVPSTVLELPSEGNHGVMVDLGYQGTAMRQMAWNRTTGTTYVRHYPSLEIGWQPWRKVYDEGSVALPVQGLLEATTTGGMRTAMGLGTASTLDSGFLPGQVMLRGHYGLGSGQDGVSSFVNDGDSLSRPTGFYCVSSSATGFTAPAGLSKAGSIVHMQRTQAGSTAQAFQIFVSETGRMFYRYAFNNAWNSWNEFYHTGNSSNVIKTFMAATTGAEARSAIGANNADNLDTGTVPVARLPEASQTAKGVTQFSTLAEALTTGTTVVKAVQPSVMQEAIRRQFNPQANASVNWNTITEPGMHPYALDAKASNGPCAGQASSVYFFCTVYKSGTSSTANLIQMATPAEDPFQSKFSNNHLLYRVRTNGTWGYWLSIVDVFNYNSIFTLLNPVQGNINGFMHFPNQMTLQWGRGATSTNNNESPTFYFPVAYDNVYVVLANHSPNATGTTHVCVSTLTNSYFRVRTDNPTVTGYSWMSIGYIDR